MSEFYDSNSQGGSERCKFCGGPLGGPDNTCAWCSGDDERVLDEFQESLSRWQKSMIGSRERNPIRRGKRSFFSVRRIVISVIALLITGYSVYFISNYHILLSQWFMDQGNFSKAEAHLQQAISEDEDNSKLTFMLGNLYFAQGRMVESIDAYSKTIAIDSTNSAALNNLAWVYSQLGVKLDVALAMSRKSLDQEPDNPFYLDTMAEIYLIKKDYFRALNYIRRAVDQDPPNKSYYLERFEKIKKLAYRQNRFIEV